MSHFLVVICRFEKNLEVAWPNKIFFKVLKRQFSPVTTTSSLAQLWFSALTNWTYRHSLASIFPLLLLALELTNFYSRQPSFQDVCKYMLCTQVAAPCCAQIKGATVIVSDHAFLLTVDIWVNSRFVPAAIDQFNFFSFMSSIHMHIIATRCKVNRDCSIRIRHYRMTWAFIRAEVDV
jgi:hypothetical protein